MKDEKAEKQAIIIAQLSYQAEAQTGIIREFEKMIQNSLSKRVEAEKENIRLHNEIEKIRGEVRRLKSVVSEW